MQQKIIILLSGIILVMLSVSAYMNNGFFFGNQASVTHSQSSKIVSADQTEADVVLDKLQKAMNIPSNPMPSISKIKDVTSLQALNPFYASAKNGDFLIVTATRAIIFDAELGLIIDMIPVRPKAPKPVDGTDAADATVDTTEQP